MSHVSHVSVFLYNSSASLPLFRALAIIIATNGISALS